MTAAAFSVDVVWFFSFVWPEEDRQRLRDWMAANGCDPNETRGFSLGEGYFDAEQLTSLRPEDEGRRWTVRRFPCSTPPPVWHTLSDAVKGFDP